MAISQSTYTIVRLGAAADSWTTRSNVRINRLWWVGATNAAHTLSVMGIDSGAGASYVIAEGIAGDTRNFAFEYDPPLNLDGVKVAAMGSGAILVYVV